MDRRRWRVGSHYGIHVYAVEDEDDRDRDVPIATALTSAAADSIVAEHNYCRVIVETMEWSGGA